VLCQSSLDLGFRQRSYGSPGGGKLLEDWRPMKFGGAVVCFM
jgi:hypothetical protein